MRTGRPKTRTAVVSAEARARIEHLAYGNLRAYRARHLPYVPQDTYYAAMRGEPVHPSLAQLIENQAVTTSEK